MSFQRFIPAVTIGALLTTLVFCSNRKINGDENLLSSITELLSEAHYEPQEIDDSFSKKVFKNYMDRIDVNKQFFTQKQYDKLKKDYSCEIDDEIKSGNSDFMDTTWSMVKQRLVQLEKISTVMLESPMNFNQTGETYNTGSEHKAFAKNEKVLENDWTSWVKWNVLDRLYRKIEAGKDSAAKSKPYDTLEQNARLDTKKYLTSWFKRLREMDQRDKLEFYANAVSEVYDPHTSYFPPAQKDNFDILMTGKLEGIGASLSQRDGFIKVESIVPGSASYKQGDLKAGDLIIKVAQGKDEPVDVVDMKLDDAIKMIRGKKDTEVRLTVKKPDGKIVVIPIVRDIVVMEDSYAKSALVEQNGKTYGVIYLPSFYADFNSRGRGRNCADDVLKEIVKLKNADVQGIILDLRNNGGGSLTDAIEMGGHFISTGPIVQVRAAGNRIQSAPDKDPNISYSGPLVILTNYYSASASEILAAAMQDYKRAIVIGTKKTFGKGTVQTFIPLKEGSFKVFKDGFGSMKVTIQKFYRINGKTTQLVGVIPDIIIPDLYDEIELGEKEMEYHLTYDEIPAARYTESKEQSMQKRTAAIAAAKSRIASDNFFNQTKSKATRLKGMRESYTYKLDLSGYTQQQKLLKEEEASYDIKYSSENVNISPLASDLREAQGDETKIAQKKDWRKGEKNDATLDQALLVLKDLNQ
jgi:carboxyl-terminal processing protease